MNDEAESVDLAEAFAFLLTSSDPLPRQLERLRDAVRAGKWDRLAEAIQCLGSGYEKCLRELEVADFVKGIIATPERFGVAELSKSDVVELLRTLRPDIEIPKDRRRWWERIGASHLQQGHGASLVSQWIRDRAAKRPDPWLNVRLFWARVLRSSRLADEVLAVTSGKAEEVPVTVGKLRARIVATEGPDGIRVATLIPEMPR